MTNRYFILGTSDTFNNKRYFTKVGDEYGSSIIEFNRDTIIFGVELGDMTPQEYFRHPQENVQEIISQLNKKLYLSNPIHIFEVHLFDSTRIYLPTDKDKFPGFGTLKDAYQAHGIYGITDSGKKYVLDYDLDIFAPHDNQYTALSRIVNDEIDNDVPNHMGSLRSRDNVGFIIDGGVMSKKSMVDILKSLQITKLELFGIRMVDVYHYSEYNDISWLAGPDQTKIEYSSTTSISGEM